MIDAILIMLGVMLICGLIAAIDLVYQINCPKCGKRMKRKFNEELDCEEYTCEHCGEKVVIYG